MIVIGPWPLSHEAHKLSGIISVCGESRLLKRKDGILFIFTDIGIVVVLVRTSLPCRLKRLFLHQRPTHPVIQLLMYTTSSTNLSLSPAVFSHHELRRPLIKHIPQSARVSCCSRLSRLLQDITRNPNNIDIWDEPFKFGEAIFTKPDCGGKRHNLANTIKKRTCEAFRPSTALHPTLDHQF